MIEDVEYLLEHCEKDSTPVYVDSSKRDQRYHPEPNEYVVEFSQPFKLVNGIEVLDASIPTTMYNVDVYNDTVALTYVSRPLYKTDVDRKLHFAEVIGTTIFQNIFEALKETALLVVDAATSTPGPGWSQLTNTTIIDDTYFIAQRTLITNVTFVNVLNTKDPALYYVRYNDTYVGIPTTAENAATIDRIRDGSAVLTTLKTTNTLAIAAYTFYAVNLSLFTYIKQTEEYYVHIQNYYKTIEIGNYDVSSLRNELNTVWTEFNITVKSTTSLDRKQGKIVFVTDELLIMNAQKSTLAKNMGFSTLPRTSDASLYSMCETPTNKRIFISNYDPIENNYKLYAPGIVNLLGERFLIMRCPEIENHLLGSFAYTTYTPGIGLFKLAASYNDVTHLRFDFVSLIRKPFHPIGKLSKLTFRFEMSGGNLYDFKGINHQMLLVIKYLVPTQKIKFQNSVLNPNYDADFMRYMSNAKSIQYREDSDNEEEFDTNANDVRYKKELIDYDFSSDDVSDDEDSDM